MKALGVFVLAVLLYFLWKSRSAVAGVDVQGDLTQQPTQPSGSTFSFSQIEDLWTANGGDPLKAPLAAAIALAESGGDPGAYNGSDPFGGSFGLFQINGVHGDMARYDPNANVQAAIAISNNGNNWKPWGAFTNGSYLKYAG